MTNFDERKHPRNGDKNLPGHAGRFAENAHNQAKEDANLDEQAFGDEPPARGRAYIDTVLRNWEPNDDFSFPQANDLEKVILVVDAVENGANTNDSVAAVFGIAPRTGAYYATAAGYMGLIQKHETDMLQQFSLTGRGQDMLALNREERADLISEMVLRLPEAETVAEDGVEGLEADLQKANDWQDSTAERRSACIGSWYESATDRERLANSVEETEAITSIRYEAAARMASTQRYDARQKAEAGRPRVGEVCQSCFTEKSLSGECNNCD